MEHFSLAPVVMVLMVAVISVTICRRLNISPMLGYLSVGFLAGPGMLHWLGHSHATEFLGEIGIVFLMFSIGLEFSLAKLKAMRYLVFGLGGAQIILTLGLGLIGLMTLYGTSFDGAFAVAAALAMSSTAIISRIMSEKAELGQTHGRMAMGVLLMQDIAVVPLMILLPAFADGNQGNLLPALGLAMLKMTVTLGLLFVVGHRIMSPWFRLVARAKSSELFMINVLLVTLGVAYITELQGLSMALGAFVAGMLLSETEYRFQVEDDIRPFRDILLGFFFITIGMKVNISALFDNWQTILALLAVLIPLKTFIVFALAKKMRHTAAESLKSALYLAQGGEFGFVILAISAKLSLIDTHLEQAAIAAVLISMIAAPFIINGSDSVIKKLSKLSDWEKQSLDLHSMLVDSMSKSEHILIIGYGRGGQSIGRILAQENIPYYALDLDAERVRVARTAGEPVSFGDAKRKEVLHAAGLNRAKAVIITIHHEHEARHILDNIMHMHPSMPVHMRVTQDDHIDTLLERGAEEVISDTKETALALAGFALISSGLPYQRAHQILMEVRRSRYRVLEGLISGSDDNENFFDSSNNIFRYAFTLPEEAHAIQRTISELPWKNMEVNLFAIRRHTSQIRDCRPDFILNSGDILIILGTKEKIISFENWCLQGEV
ncbi:MAG: cation:proton antiporter [Neisseria sp.]|nr:cation:proton antiporter [Neisseria sp.]